MSMVEPAIFVLCLVLRVTRRFENKLPIFWKSSQNSLQDKEIPKFTQKFKVKNIYFKPLLKLLNTYNKPWFETVYLGENVVQLHKQKVAQNMPIFGGWFIFSKYHN